MGRTLILTKTKRVADKIIDLMCKDQLDEAKTLIPYLGTEYNRIYKNKFLKVAINHCAENCADYLIKDGATLNLNYTFRECKWDMTLEVYALCQRLSEKHKLDFTHTKSQLVERILEPSRVDRNPERIEYFLKIIESGFVDFTETKSTIMSLHKNTTKPERIKRILRELSFHELGI